MDIVHITFHTIFVIFCFLLFIFSSFYQVFFSPFLLFFLVSFFHLFFFSTFLLFFSVESISSLKKLKTFRIARNDLEVVRDLMYLRHLEELTHLRIDENPISLLEHTVPYAIFCVHSLDTINGKSYSSYNIEILRKYLTHIEKNSSDTGDVNSECFHRLTLSKFYLFCRAVNLFHCFIFILLCCI